MARRKQQVVEPEPTQQVQVESADDAIEDARQQVSDEATTKFLGEEVKDNKIVEAPKETPKAPPKEEPTLTGADIEEEIEIDPKKMKEEIAASVTKDTVDKITKALTGKEETTKEERDKYEVIAENFAKEKGRNPTWFELVKFIKEDIREEMKNETVQETKIREERIKQVKEQDAQRQKAFNQFVDEEFKELVDTGKFPANDEKARQALFQTMLNVNQERVKEGKPPIYSVNKIFHMYYKPPTAQPAGADAPISAGRGNAQPESTEEYSYKDISGKSFVDIRSGK